MGASSSIASKGEMSEEQRRAADRIKTCLLNHQSNVFSLNTAIYAQRDTVKLLIQMVSDLQTTGVHGGDPENLERGPIATAQSLLSNIEKTMEQQCSSLNGSFKVLENCMCDVLQDYMPGTYLDSEQTRLDSSKHREASDTLGHGRERHSALCDMNISNTEYKMDGTSKYILGLETDNKKFKEKIEENDRMMKKLQGDNDNVNSEIKMLTDTVSRQKDEIRMLQKQREELREKANARNMIERKLKRVENDNTRLEQKVYQLERQIEYLEDEKRKQRERKISVPVQLYYQRRDELMSAVVEELSAMLVTQMSVKNIQLDIQRCENSSNIQPDKPTLVLCINASRLGTDAAAAIEGVHKSGRTSLLIFHHKNIHALPNHPSERMLTSAEFKALGGIFDLAFLSGKGIYPCNMNNVAMTGIEEFIRQNIAV